MDVEQRPDKDRFITLLQHQLNQNTSSSSTIVGFYTKKNQELSGMINIYINIKGILSQYQYHSKILNRQPWYLFPINNRLLEPKVAIH